MHWFLGGIISFFQVRHWPFLRTISKPLATRLNGEEEGVAQTDIECIRKNHKRMWDYRVVEDFVWTFSHESLPASKLLQKPIL